MDDAGYDVELSPEAERDYLNELIWLEENRSSDIADRFLKAFDNLKNRLSISPLQWQKVPVVGVELRRAILLKKYVVLYDVFAAEERVVILRIRGTAEDWTNQSI